MKSATKRKKLSPLKYLKPIKKATQIIAIQNKEVNIILKLGSKQFLEIMRPPVFTDGLIIFKNCFDPSFKIMLTSLFCIAIICVAFLMGFRYLSGDSLFVFVFTSSQS